MSDDSSESPEDYYSKALVLERMLVRWVESFGAPLVALVLLFVAVWFFGSEQTQDEFIRALLFQEGDTAKPLMWAVVTLLAGWIFTPLYRRLLTKIDEIKVSRVDQERLQDELHEAVERNVALEAENVALKDTFDGMGLQVEVEHANQSVQVKVTS